MNYFYYLKKQVNIFALMVLTYNTVYYIAVFLNWRCPASFPIENVFAYGVSFIFAGAYFHYSKQT